MKKEVKPYLFLALLGIVSFVPDTQWENNEPETFMTNASLDLPHTELAAPIPTPTPEAIQRHQLFDRVIGPFIKEAKILRQKRSEDTEYSKRIDWELNKDRVNFLLHGWGETHEPPLTERAFIGSLTIVSYDISANVFDFVSLTHDIRAPEVERYQKEKGDFEGYLIKIDKAYPLGGFPLMRQTLENATGLVVDFQIAFSDSVLVNFVDSVFGGIEVEVPKDFSVTPFYLDGVKYPEGDFSKGIERMDGKRVLQFIKTVPKTTGGRYYGRELEHNIRKHLAFGAVKKSLQENIDNPWFWVKALGFVMKDQRGVLNFDFDPRVLLVKNLWDLTTGLGRFVVSDNKDLMPEIRKEIYLVDSAHGQGGVRWVMGDPNPITRRDVARGVYKDLATEVPIGGNPYAEDLVTGYWSSVRETIKRLILD